MSKSKEYLETAIKNKVVNLKQKLEKDKKIFSPKSKYSFRDLQDKMDEYVTK